MSHKEQLAAEIEKTILELGYVYSFWFPNKASTAVIDDHISPLHRGFINQLNQGINFAEVDVLPWEQIEEYVNKLLLPEFEKRNQKTIDGCVMFMATIYRTIQSEMALAEENETLAMRRAFQASHFSGILRGIGNDHQDIKTLASMMGSKGAKAKLINDPRQSEKTFIKECWETWQQKPATYDGKAAFARDMLSKCEHLKSQKKIEDWCREWSAANGTMAAE